jgi:hypothetical protein
MILYSGTATSVVAACSGPAALYLCLADQPGLTKQKFLYNLSRAVCQVNVRHFQLTRLHVKAEFVL